MGYGGYDANDPDGPQAIDLADDDDQTVDCPACGAAVYEDAAICPKCGQWMTETSPAERRARGWFWPVMVAVLIAVILVFWHGLRTT